MFFIIKKMTETTEITVTNEAISGKLSNGKIVDIPFNQITSVKRDFFNGISITANGETIYFYWIENREEVLKAIQYLRVNSQQVFLQSGSGTFLGNTAE